MKPGVLVQGKKIVVDAVNPIRGYIEVGGKRYRNVLTRNLIAVLYGLFNDVNVSAVDIGGSSRSVRTSGSVNGDPTRFRYGTGTATPSLDDFKLASETGNPLVPPSLVTSDTTVSVLWQLVPPSDVSEVGVSQLLLDSTGTTYYHILYTRALVSAVAGQVLNYALEISPPLNLNFGALLLGFFRDENIGMTAIDGTSFTARTSDDLNAGKATVVVSDVTHSGSPFSLALTPYVSVPSAVFYGISPGGLLLGVAGVFRPTADYVIRTIGVAQSISDTGGTGRMTLLAVMPLPSPVTIPAGQARSIMFRIWYMP